MKCDKTITETSIVKTESEFGIAEIKIVGGSIDNIRISSVDESNVFLLTETDGLKFLGFIYKVIRDILIELNKQPQKIKFKIMSKDQSKRFRTNDIEEIKLEWTGYGKCSAIIINKQLQVFDLHYQGSHYSNNIIRFKRKKEIKNFLKFIQSILVKSISLVIASDIAVIVKELEDYKTDEKY